MNLTVAVYKGLFLDPLGLRFKHAGARLEAAVANHDVDGRLDASRASRARALEGGARAVVEVGVASPAGRDGFVAAGSELVGCRGAVRSNITQTKAENQG